MAKQRASARREREANAARAATEATLARERAAAERARRDRWTLLWRRSRLWQHGPGFGRNRERWAALGTLVLVVLVLTYLFTSSVGAVLLVCLVLVIAGPVLAMVFLDRSRK
jgi:Flp pilus assembly protein TadB